MNPTKARIFLKKTKNSDATRDRLTVCALPHNERTAVCATVVIQARIVRPDANNCRVRARGVCRSNERARLAFDMLTRVTDESVRVVLIKFDLKRRKRSGVKDDFHGARFRIARFGLPLVGHFVAAMRLADAFSLSEACKKAALRRHAFHS